MIERMTREQALERVRGMWNMAAADGYQHTMDVFADAMMAVQSEVERRSLGAFEDATREILSELNPEDDWASICSAHQKYEPECRTCQCGTWRVTGPAIAKLGALLEASGQGYIHMGPARYRMESK